LPVQPGSYEPMNQVKEYLRTSVYVPALATCVAEKAMNRNMKLLPNSPTKAMNSFRARFGHASFMLRWE